MQPSSSHYSASQPNVSVSSSMGGYPLDRGQLRSPTPSVHSVAQAHHTQAYGNPARYQETPPAQTAAQPVTHQFQANASRPVAHQSATQYQQTSYQRTQYQATSYEPTQYQQSSSQPAVHQPGLYQQQNGRPAGYQPTSYQPTSYQPTAY